MFSPALEQINQFFKNSAFKAQLFQVSSFRRGQFAYFNKSTNTIINIIITKMRIINSREIFACLFVRRNACLFSNIRKKINRSFQLGVLKEDHQQDSDNSIMGKLPKEMWQIPQKKIEPLEGEDHSGEYLGLKHLEEAFKFRIAETEIMKMHFESGSISEQKKLSNSQTFMKLISHSLSQERCDQIINLIQAHCAEMRGEVQQKIGFVPSSLRNYEYSRKSQEVLFQKIQSIMMEDMLVDESTREDNTEYINYLLKILAQSDLFSISHEFYDQNSQIEEPEDYKPKEIRKFLNSEYFNQAQRIQQTHEQPRLKKNRTKESQNENKLQQALKIRQNQKSTKSHVKTMRNRSAAPKELKIKVAPQEDIFFTKINKQDKEQKFKIEQSRKYAYLYDLPFFVSDAQCKDLIHHFQTTRKIKIASYKLFTYGSYFELVSKQKKFHIPQFYQTDGTIQKIYEEVDLQMYLNSDKNAKKSKAKLKDQSSGLSWTTQALLKKIKRQKYSMFNRSVLVVKFESEQQKKKWMNPEARLYGINYKNMKNIKLEQGFSKTVVRVHGIPPGCTTTELNQFLNTVFQQMGYNFQVQRDLYLSKNYILIQFQHFVQVLKAVDLLQNRMFQEKELKAEIIYGSSKVFKGNFSTSLNDSHQQLKERVVQISKKYYQINEEGQF